MCIPPEAHVEGYVCERDSIYIPYTVVPLYAPWGIVAVPCAPPWPAVTLRLAHAMWRRCWQSTARQGSFPPIACSDTLQVTRNVLYWGGLVVMVVMVVMDS